VAGLSTQDRRELLKDAQALLAPSARRLFLRRGATLGGLAMLTGCSASTSQQAEHLLMRVSRFNDSVQAWLFDPDRLAPTYPQSMITRPFPFNAYYGESEAPTVKPDGYFLMVGGRVEHKDPWALEQLAALPQQEQITRHICVEGWSAIGRWGGVSFATFLERIGADKSARYVGFKCADDYYTSIDMPTALHSQTLLTLTYDGQTLPRKYGFPMKLRMPTKLGYKNPKHITEVFVTNDYPGGYWEDQGYNWFGGS
jgi:DMSO/TMAO reductase YedYZ molybdopterin-dependent catalytic subunit